MKLLRRLIFMITLYAFADLYVAVSFYHATGSRWVWGIFALILISALMMPVVHSQEESWGEAYPWTQPFLTLIKIYSQFTVGVFSMLFVFSVVRDFLLLTSGLFISKASHEWASQWSLKIEIGLLLALVVVGVIQAIQGPRIKRVQVPIAGLPQAFEGFRIVQVSDLHIGPTIRKAYVRNVVDAVNSHAADMIALTGDITDGSPAELGAIAGELGKMQSTFGRYFVTGNHEYYWDAPAWTKFHRDAGTHVLVNESRLIKKDGASIAVLGVSDVNSHYFVADHISDPKRAAEGVSPETIKILLAHQPSSYKAAHLAGVHLQLSGHTHAGQFFPWNLMIGFFHDYYRGLNRFKDMWIYVNSGTGYWGPPLRTAVSSEITVLTLTCA